MEEAYQWYRELEGKDPVTDDIDSIDGYLRDYRIFDDEAQMARNALRMDLTASDISNARTSVVVTGLSSAGRSSNVNSKASRNEQRKTHAFTGDESSNRARLGDFYRCPYDQ